VKTSNLTKVMVSWELYTMMKYWEEIDGIDIFLIGMNFMLSALLILSYK
jgi:hypothetical protein